MLNTEQIKRKMSYLSVTADLAVEAGKDQDASKAERELDNLSRQLEEVERKIKAEKKSRDFANAVAVNALSDKADFDDHLNWTVLDVISNELGNCDRDFMEQAVKLLHKSAKGFSIIKESQCLFDQMATSYGQGQG